MYWITESEKKIVTNESIARVRYEIECLEGKAYTKDARFMPDGFFRLSAVHLNSCHEFFDRVVLKECSINEGDEELRKLAEEDNQKRLKPFEGKRRYRCDYRMNVWIDFDSEVGVNFDDFEGMYCREIEKVNKFLEANGYHVFLDYNTSDLDEIRCACKKDEYGHVFFDSEGVGSEYYEAVTYPTIEELGLDPIE